MFRSFVALKLLLPMLVCWKISESTGFVPNPSIFGKGVVTRTMPVSTTPNREKIQRFAADSGSGSEETEIDGNEDGNSNHGKDEGEDDGDEAPIAMSTVKIDEGGKNLYLTDRFKYKVHALMGDYDPTEGMADDEDQDGNIMNALIKFPTQHVFDVVGKVSPASNDNDDDDSDADDEKNENETHKDYADQVKTIVFETTGDEDMECDIIPRGTKFVKVRCTAMVQSTTMINTIYDELGKMESTVMKF